MNEKNEKYGKYSFCCEWENYKTSFDGTKFEKCPLNQKLRESSKKRLKQIVGDEAIEKKAIEYYMDILDVSKSQVYKIIRGEYNLYKKLEEEYTNLENVAKILNCSVEEIECPCQKRPKVTLIGVAIPNPANYYLSLCTDPQFSEYVLEFHEAIYDIGAFLSNSQTRSYKKLDDIIKVLPEDILKKLNLQKMDENSAYSKFNRNYIIMILRSYYKIDIEY